MTFVCVTGDSGDAAFVALRRRTRPLPLSLPLPTEPRVSAGCVVGRAYPGGRLSWLAVIDSLRGYSLSGPVFHSLIFSERHDCFCFCDVIGITQKYKKNPRICWPANPNLVRITRLSLGVFWCSGTAVPQFFWAAIGLND